MSGAPTDRATPISNVRPVHDRALRALKALDEGRLADAEQNLLAMPETQAADRAWKSHLAGLLAFERGQLDRAGECFRQAAALALQGDQAEMANDSHLLRLAAEAMNHEGHVLRRGERLSESIRAHEFAYQLRVEHGSQEEQWESAIDVGLDHHLQRRFDDASAWYECALRHAHDCTERRDARLAKTWDRNYANQLARGEFASALAAARSSRDLWRAHDPGCAEEFVAAMHTGHALLMRAQAEHATDPRTAAALLGEAVEGLAAAQSELAAFGEEAAVDARACAELHDFAQRLLASLSD